MKKRILLAIMFSVAILSGCGGHGGSAPERLSENAPVNTRTAKFVAYSSATLPGKSGNGMLTFWMNNSTTSAVINTPWYNVNQSATILSQVITAGSPWGEGSIELDAPADLLLKWGTDNVGLVPVDASSSSWYDPTVFSIRFCVMPDGTISASNDTTQVCAGGKENMSLVSATLNGSGYYDLVVEIRWMFVDAVDTAPFYTLNNVEKALNPANRIGGRYKFTIPNAMNGQEYTLYYGNGFGLPPANQKFAKITGSAFYDTTIIRFVFNDGVSGGTTPKLYTKAGAPVVPVPGVSGQGDGIFISF